MSLNKIHLDKFKSTYVYNVSLMFCFLLNFLISRKATHLHTDYTAKAAFRRLKDLFTASENRFRFHCDRPISDQERDVAFTWSAYSCYESI